MTPFIKKFSMTTLESSLIKSKFRGCLLGSLIGDCVGAPFEGDIISHGEKITIQRYFDKLQDPTFKAPYKQYTDDTAMTKSVAKFLIDKPEPDYKFLAKLFVTEYFNDPKRGYGKNVVEVFQKLRNTKYHNVYKPAREQFFGGGSYGNGGAMRIAPVALYFYNNYKAMIDVTKNVTKITHSNILGINGALLQCIAVHQALLSDPENSIDPKTFCSELSTKMKDVEELDEDNFNNINDVYHEKLRFIEQLLQKDNDDLDEEIIAVLGNGIRAHESVPTAIYCFLKAQNEIPTIDTENSFRRTIQYAITLGGDTDTIASMAGAIAGAYFGEDAVNSILAKHCEYNKETLETAENLFKARESSPVK